MKSMNHDARKWLSPEDEAYVKELYRVLHQCPECGFDLPETLAVIQEELEKLGLPYTDRYGRSSVTVDLGGKHGGPTIAVRADIDALPVLEKTGLEYASQHPGKMHACGHDAHTAMALGAARALVRKQEELPYRVRLMFQPSEECDVSGARMMVEHGVLTDVDMVVAQHMAPDLDTGVIAVCRHEAASACCPVDITFTGLSAHATKPQAAKDALAMAVQAYNAITLSAFRTIDPMEQYVCSISSLRAGDVHNVISAEANMKISIRTYKPEVMEQLVSHVKLACRNAAAEFGGNVEIRADISSHATVNDTRLSQQVIRSAEKVVDASRVSYLQPRMNSDDFAWFTAERPSVLFWTGTRNLREWPEKSLHNNDFLVDEASLAIGTAVMLQLLEDLGTRSDQILKA